MSKFMLLNALLVIVTLRSTDDVMLRASAVTSSSSANVRVNASKRHASMSTLSVPLPAVSTANWLKLRKCKPTNLKLWHR